MTRSLAVILLAIAATPAAADVSRGLDHARHQESATAAAKDVACVDCHGEKASGVIRDRPGHRWCFGTCHPTPAKASGRKPYQVTALERPLCEVCHSAASISSAAKTGSVSLRGQPTFPAAGDFATQMSHASHVKQACASCHAFARSKPLPHSRCASCHRRGPAAAAAAMTDCGQCHGKAPRAQDRTPFSVVASFSHRKHAPRVAGDCERCHPTAKTSATMDLPRPSKATCSDCHAGETAFSITEAKCRKCHSAPETLGARVRAAVVPLTHKSHAALKCEICHRDDGAFKASAGHALCANADCHPGEYAARSPTICSSCHVGSEPWLPQHVDLPRRTSADFGVVFDHRAHPKVAKTATESCTSCHVGDPSNRSDGLPRAHASCTGSGCHEVGAKIEISACESCHVAGAREARRTASLSRPWNVAAQFVHSSHRTDASGGVLGCESCHELSATPPTGRDIAAPAKKTCAGCHDGGTSFKLTGHQCKRCHKR